MLMLAFSLMQRNTAVSSLLMRVNTSDHMSRSDRIAVGKIQIAPFQFFQHFMSCFCFGLLNGSIATLSLFSSKTALSTGCPRVGGVFRDIVSSNTTSLPPPCLKTTAAALKLNTV